MFSFTAITCEALQNNELIESLPDFYALKNVVEHNAGHIHQTVFDHCLKSAKALQVVLGDVSPAVHIALSKKIDGVTKKELLFLATLFHDIGKGSMEPDRNGIFINHEAIGADVLKEKILPYLDISPAAQDRICELVRQHGLLHAFSNDVEGIHDRFASTRISAAEYLPDLVLLVLADLMGGDLDRLDPPTYRFKIDFFSQQLKNWA